jgi:RNA polymerase sigma-70 factor (ECF subfamily)
MDDNEVREQLARHHTDAHGWAIRCCAGHRNEAEDVLHTAYWKILDGKARFAGGSSFKTWLFGVIRYTALEEFRRRTWNPLASDRYAEPIEEVASEGGPDRLAEASEQQDALRMAMGTLPQRQQQVLHLVFYQGLTIEDAAGVLGISVGSARTHYERGKEKMREQLDRRHTRPSAWRAGTDRPTVGSIS